MRIEGIGGERVTSAQFASGVWDDLHQTHGALL